MRRKVVFLDRDGVINQESGEYVTTWKRFVFLPKSLEALRRLHEGGYKTIVISNQAGVSKGVYSRKALWDITCRMQKTVRKSGGRLDAVYYCLQRSSDNCLCQKPKTGLFRKAKERFGICLREAYVVGDSRRDIEAGKAIGCKTILVLSGRIKRRPRWKVMPDTVRKDLGEAVKWILQKESKRS